MQDLLQRGIAAARAGRRSEARQLLMQVVEADDQSEQGWLWLSGVVDSPADAQVCLENVLALNPENRQARQGLEWILARTSQPKTEPPPETRPIPSQSSLAASKPGFVSEIYTPTPAVPARQPSERIVPPDPLVVPQPAAPPARQPIREPVPPAASERTATIEVPEPELPCPYCGAPTEQRQHNCLNCRKSLMFEAPAAPQRSIWTTLLGWLRMADAAFAVLAGLALLASAVLVWQTGRSVAQANLPFVLATLAVGVFAYAWLLYAIGRAVWQRMRWGYLASAALLLVSILGYLGRMAIPGLATQINPELAQNPQFQSASGQANTISLACITLVFVSQIALLALSFRDFFRPKQRFQPVVPKGEPVEHYNRGVAYKDRGMWYMAMREWEMAILRAPRDLNYLHALGLAYAQLGRFERARTTLDRALGLAPGHRQLTESRALVEQMARKAT